MRSLCLELKLALTILAIAVVTAAAGAWAAGAVFERNVEGATLATLQNAADAFAAEERSEIAELASALDALMASEALRDAFAARDRDRLVRIAGPLLATMRERDRITHWCFIDPDRTVFLRVHRPELHGDRVERTTLLQAIETRELGAGKEVGQDAFALRVVRPWFHGGKLIGYVELSEEIGHFLTAIKTRTGDEYALLVKKRFLDEQTGARVLGSRASTWKDRPDAVVVDTTTFTPGIIDYAGDLESIPERGGGLGETELGDRAYLRGIFPVRDAAGRKVGGLFVLHDFTQHHRALRAAVAQTFLALLVAGVVASALAVAAARALVFRRLARLRAELEEGAGRTGLPRWGIVEPGSDDDLARLEALFRRMRIPGGSHAAPEGSAAERREAGPPNPPAPDAASPRAARAR